MNEQETASELKKPRMEDEDGALKLGSRSVHGRRDKRAKQTLASVVMEHLAHPEQASDIHQKKQRGHQSKYRSLKMSILYKQPYFTGTTEQGPDKVLNRQPPECFYLALTSALHRSITPPSH